MWFTSRNWFYNHKKFTNESFAIGHLHPTIVNKSFQTTLETIPTFVVTPEWSADASHCQMIIWFGVIARWRFLLHAAPSFKESKLTFWQVDHRTFWFRRPLSTTKLLAFHHASDSRGLILPPVCYTIILNVKLFVHQITKDPVVWYPVHTGVRHQWRNHVTHRKERRDNDGINWKIRRNWGTGRLCRVACTVVQRLWASADYEVLSAVLLNLVFEEILWSTLWTLNGVYLQKGTGERGRDQDVNISDSPDF